MSEYRFAMSIRNDGTASARDTLMVVECNYPMLRVDWEGPFPHSLFPPTNVHRVQALASRPIHPLEDKIIYLSCTVQAPTHLNFQGDRADRITDPTRIVFAVGVYALDVRAFRGSVAFGPQYANEAPINRAVVREVSWQI